jgi:hypothetical protein
MGKTKFNPSTVKPRRSGVYRVQQKALALWDESSEGIMEGFAWFDATLKRWAGIRPTPGEAKNSRDTAQRSFSTGQEKEWARV